MHLYNNIFYKWYVCISYFQNQTNFCHQIDDCAMDSASSNTIAQVEYVGQIITKKEKHDAMFFKRYVDDCISIAFINKITEMHTKFKQIITVN